MDLWKDTHSMCHFNANPSAPPDFNKQWPSGFESTSVEAFDGAFAHSQVAADDEINEIPDGLELRDEQEIGRNNKNEALEAISKAGIDAVALYAPIHFFGSDKWGIYIHERRFFGLCSALIDELRGGANDWNGVVADLYQALMRHEYFHSAVELFSLTFEDIAGPLDESNCAYNSYFDVVYSKSFPKTNCIEETLATASEFNIRFSTPGFLKALKNISVKMPEAYSNWRAYSDPEEFCMGVQDLAAQIRINAEHINRRNGELVGIWPSLTYAQIQQCQKPIGNIWFPATRPKLLDRFGPIPRWIYVSGGVTSQRTLKKLMRNFQWKNS